MYIHELLLPTIDTVNERILIHKRGNEMCTLSQRRNLVEKNDVTICSLFFSELALRL